MCAEDNMQVANCTTPANYFHILRRQLKREIRKPLILMTPKTLLRHKRAVSRLDELGPDASFHRLLWDDAQTNKDEKIKLVADDKIRRVVLCSGKVYFDLLEEREKRGLDDIYLLRVEQLYPFPTKALMTELSRFKQAEIVWCQEEPRNMGAWFFVDTFIEWVLNQIGAKHRRPRYAGPPRDGGDRDRPDVEAPGAAEGVPRRGAGVTRSSSAAPVSRASTSDADRRLDRPSGRDEHDEQDRIDMAEIRVPALGESVTEATIGNGSRSRATRSRVDEPLVELETDKVTIEVPAPAAGTLGEIAAKDGDTVAVGALLGADQGRRGRAREAGGRKARARRSRAPKPKRRSRASRAAEGRRAPTRRSRRRCARSRPRPAWTRPRSTAAARTAASPRAT